jgi:hypothetical protein
MSKAKDQTVVGITGKPIPKPRTAKQQYELEKKRRQEKHLGKNVGGTQYRSDVNPYYNPRARTFEEFMSICEAKVPVTRQAGDFRYSGKTGEEKAERRANVLSNSPDPKKRRQANTIRSKIKTVADRDTAQATGNAMKKLYKGQQKRANELASQLMNKEEVEIGEGIGMTMASALGNPPALSNRMKLKRVLLAREIEKETKKNKKRKFSGKAETEAENK